MLGIRVGFEECKSFKGLVSIHSRFAFDGFGAVVPKFVIGRKKKAGIAFVEVAIGILEVVGTYLAEVVVVGRVAVGPAGHQNSCSF